MQTDLLLAVLDGKVEKTFPVSKIVRDMITFCAAELYPYEVYLRNNSGRSDEADIVTSYRTKLFDIRNTLDDGNCTYKKASEQMQSILDTLNVHIALIRKNPETKWEPDMISCLTREMSGIIYHISHLE